MAVSPTASSAVHRPPHAGRSCSRCGSYDRTQRSVGERQRKVAICAVGSATGGRDRVAHSTAVTSPTRSIPRPAPVIYAAVKVQ